MPFSKFSTKKGFTLIEIVLFLFVLLAIVAILFSTSSTFVSSRSSSLQSTASKIASRELESLRNTPFDSLPGSGSFSDSDLAKLPSGSANLNIADYGDPPDPDIKLVTIDIDWTDGNAPKELIMETLISENGL